MNEVTNEKKKRRIPITLKLLILTGIALALLIPQVLILNLVREREERQRSVVHEISSKWGENQTIIGPIVTVPYYEYYQTVENNKTKIMQRTAYAHFLPEDLIIEGTIVPEKKHRGIYEIVVYRAQLNISGTFKKPDFSNWDIPAKHIQWEDAFLTIGINDLKGLNEYISIKWNENSYTLQSGIPVDDNFNSGVNTPVDIGKESIYRYSFTIDVNGTEMLSFVPVGRETNVTLYSDWPNPSFDGAYITEENVVNENGFKASWKILELNRNFGQQWIGRQHHPNDYNNDSLDDFAFGVNLIIPVDHYQKNERSVKYAILFIALTFIVFFFAEVLNKRPIHPVQYTLVGIALCIFYTLLISLSEHISFNLSYLIASIAIIGLIALYARSAYKSTKVSLIVAGVLVALYAFLFTILQLIDYSLLFGNIGLFIVLAIIMFFSKKINWYGTDNES